MTISDRGRIPLPDLDDRTWQDLVDEMLRLRAEYAPQWTDHNPSDIGITLVELFAFLAEGLIYRINRMPEKNYLAFLNLLGITRDPPTPALAFLTFTAGRDVAGPISVAAGTQVQTSDIETTKPVVFETDRALTVLPANLGTAVVIGPYDSAAVQNARYLDRTPELIGARGFLGTLTAGQAVQMCFGFDAPILGELALGLRLHRSAPPPILRQADGTPVAQIRVAWRRSRAGVAALSWPQFTDAVDGTDGLRHDGTVRLTMPADWSAQRPSPRPGVAADGAGWGVPAADPAAAITDEYRWIALQITNTSTDPVAISFDRIMFNTVAAHNALTIDSPENLGTGDGSAFQSFALAHCPLYRQLDAAQPYDHLTIQVAGETWRLVDELPAGAGKCYRLDPVTGEIMFGNFDERGNTGHGSVPPRGAAVTATGYRWVAGGAEGNVGDGRIAVPVHTLTGIASITNHGPGFDGSDEEAIDNTLRRAPEVLKTRDRAVTAEDYEFLAREATTDVVSARCLPPRLQELDEPTAGVWKKGDPWRFAGISREPGAVTVVVVTDEGSAALPQPSAFVIQEVRRYLDQRRDLTARLDVVGPRYLPVRVSVSVKLWQQAADAGVTANDVAATIKTAINRFLHPTQGGPAGTGWSVGQSVLVSDVFRAIAPSADIAFISSLTVEAGIPLYHLPPLNPGGTAANYKPELERPVDKAPPGASVQLADYELVCAAADHTVDVKVE